MTNRLPIAWKIMITLGLTLIAALAALTASKKQTDAGSGAQSRRRSKITGPNPAGEPRVSVCKLKSVSTDVRWVTMGGNVIPDEDTRAVIIAEAHDLVRAHVMQGGPLSEQHAARISVIVDMAAVRKIRLGVPFEASDLQSETMDVLNRMAPAAKA